MYYPLSNFLNENGIALKSSAKYEHQTSRSSTQTILRIKVPNTFSQFVWLGYVFGSGFPLHEKYEKKVFSKCSRRKEMKAVTKQHAFHVVRTNEEGKKCSLITMQTSIHSKQS